MPTRAAPATKLTVSLSVSLCVSTSVSLSLPVFGWSAGGLSHRCLKNWYAVPFIDRHLPPDNGVGAGMVSL